MLKPKKIVLSLEQVHIILQRNLKLKCNYQIKMTRKIIVMISTQMNSKLSKMIINSRNMMTVKKMNLSSTKQSNKIKASKMSLTTIRSILVLPIKLKTVTLESTILSQIIWHSSRSTPHIRL